MRRRDFLRTSSAIVVSFVFDAALPRALTAQSRGTTSDSAKPLDPEMVDSFLAIHADGSVAVYSGKVDIGTGMRIAVAQMVAEEIGVPVTRIAVIDGDSGLCPDQGGTGGSNGLTRGGMEIRRAAATARRALLTMGADSLKRDVSELLGTAFVNSVATPAVLSAPPRWKPSWRKTNPSPCAVSTGRAKSRRAPPPTAAFVPTSPAA